MCLPCDRFMNSNYQFVFDSMMKFQPSQKVTEITPWTFGFYSNKQKMDLYLRKKNHHGYRGKKLWYRPNRVLNPRKGHDSCDPRGPQRAATPVIVVAVKKMEELPLFQHTTCQCVMDLKTQCSERKTGPK